MFSSVFSKKEVRDLLKKVSENPRYNDKKKKDSINYEKFSGLEQPFFLLFDALIKYQIIIGEEEYLADFVHHLDLLLYKIDNFHDIHDGICKILVKFCAKKLGYKNKIEEYRKEILEYIYQKYIVEGYLYHGVSNSYVEDIKQNGFVPQKYRNLYSRFEQLQEKYSSFLKDMDFRHDYVSFTDDFVIACYYATYSPIYFSSFLCPPTSKKAEINSYAKRDYIGCFKELHHTLKLKEINEEDSRQIEKLCNDEWKLLRQNESLPTIMMVKRKYFSKDKIQGIQEFFLDKETDISSLASQIMDYKIDSLAWNKSIPKENIEFITIPYSEFVVEKETTKVEIVLPTVRVEQHSEDGKVSFLVLLGSLFILLGVLASIIMLYQ